MSRGATRSSLGPPISRVRGLAKIVGYPASGTRKRGVGKAQEPWISEELQPGAAMSENRNGPGAESGCEQLDGFAPVLQLGAADRVVRVGQPGEAMAAYELVDRGGVLRQLEQLRDDHLLLGRGGDPEA